MEYIKTIYDCATGETVTRPLTADELSEFEKAVYEAEVERKAQELLDAQREAAKATAKEKLEALGLTAEEIAAITGA